MNIFVISPHEALSTHLFAEHTDNFTKAVYADIGAARENLLAIRPDIIVAEHADNDEDIFEFCRELKADTQQQGMFVLVSTNRDPEFWLNAYDVGVDTIVYNDLSNEILKLKLNSIFQCASHKESLQKNLSETQKIAMTAMTGNNELGQIIRFVQKSYAINDYAELAESFFAVTNGLGLLCSLMFKTDEQQHFFSTEGLVKKLEEDVFALVDGSQRFVDFGSRTIISYPNVVLLVKNMPVEDPERYGHIKDLLPALLDVVQAKVVSLEVAHAVQEQTVRLGESFDAIERSFQYISELSRENVHEGTGKLQSMLMELNDTLPSMGLEEDQEAFILNRIESSIEDSRKMLDMSNEMEVIFKGIHNNMQSVVTQQNQLLHSLLKSGRGIQEDTVDGVDTMDDDVELF